MEILPIFMDKLQHSI